MFRRLQFDRTLVVDGARELVDTLDVGSSRPTAPGSGRFLVRGFDSAPRSKSSS